MVKPDWIERCREELFFIAMSDKLRGIYQQLDFPPNKCTYLLFMKKRKRETPDIFLCFRTLYRSRKARQEFFYPEMIHSMNETQQGTTPTIARNNLSGIGMKMPSLIVEKCCNRSKMSMDLL
jgi:hypothetical protein